MHANTQPFPWDDEVVSLAVEVLQVLADSTRLRIAGLLLDGELSVGQIAEALERPVPGISQHLARMRLARVVNSRKQGTSVYYRIENDHVQQLVQDTIGHVEHLIDAVPAHHLVGSGRDA